MKSYFNMKYEQWLIRIGSFIRKELKKHYLWEVLANDEYDYIDKLEDKIWRLEDELNLWKGL